MRIIQLTDCHITTDPEFQLKGVCTRATLQQVLALVQDRHADADYVVVTGDLTHDEQLGTYQIVRDLLGPWWPRLRLIPGNHDHRGHMRQVFEDRLQALGNRNVFSDQLQGWKLIGLDSQEPGEVHGRVGEEQLSWLEAQLGDSRALPACVFVHHPVVSVQSAWLDAIGLRDSEQLLSVVNRHSNARVVCCGHVHQEHTAVTEKTLVVTTPSTGVQFRPHADVLELDAVGPGFRVLELGSAGQVNSWVERVVLVE